MQSQLTIRPPTSGDWPRISSDWHRGGRHAAAWGGVGNDVWHHHAQRLVSVWWEHPRVVWRIAHGADADRILGWSAWLVTGDWPVLHWIHVRRDIRGMGVGSQLLSATVGTTRRYWYSSSTPDFEAIAHPGGTYNPLAIGYYLPGEWWK